MEKPVDITKLLEKVETAMLKKSQLTEKRTEKDIQDLLKKKGW